jgi:outer membrane immunogenic protein
MGTIAVNRIFAASIGAMLACAAGAASAADLPAAPIYTKAAAPVVTYNWTGCYAGANGGGLWADKEWWQVGGAGALFSGHSVDGGIGGVQIGCDYQFAGHWVVGIQGDYDWASATGSGVHSTLATLTDQSHISGVGSVTGRVGYAWDRFLGYVKGGGAWDRDSYLQFFPATGAAFATSSETRGGWTVGIGGEYAVWQNLSVFLEYDYYDFGSNTVTFTGPTVIAPIRIHEDQSVVKVGLNWLFNASGPVLARY